MLAVLPKQSSYGHIQTTSKLTSNGVSDYIIRKHLYNIPVQ